MGTIALVLVAWVLGWIGTLSLVRDMSRLAFTDCSIAALGALLAGLLLPRLGYEPWGEYGLRASTIFAMAVAAILTLIVANLIRGRGFRAGAQLTSSRYDTQRRNIAA